MSDADLPELPVKDSPYCPECGCRCENCSTGRLSWQEAAVFIAATLALCAVALAFLL